MAMVIAYLAPPLLALGSVGLPQLLGIAAWTQMAVALQPTLRFYGVSPWYGIALPAIAAVVLSAQSLWLKNEGTDGARRLTISSSRDAWCSPQFS